MIKKQQWDVPKRYLKMTLYKGDNKTSIMNKFTIDTAVKFNTSESVTGALNEANITISGIKLSNMFYLSTSTTQWIKDWIQNRIVIEAGYDNQYSKIFDGNVISGKPNLNNADYSINLKCMSMFSELTKNKSYSFEGNVSVVQIAQQFAQELGLGFVNGLDGKDILISNYNLRNTNTVSALRNLAQMTGLNIYISNNRLYIKPENVPLKNTKTFFIQSHDIIGSPEPTDTGVIVNVRMNPSFITGQSVLINSIKYRELKSYKFFVMTLSHSGDTYGKDWFTRLSLIKEGLGYYQ